MATKLLLPTTTTLQHSSNFNSRPPPPPPPPRGKGERCPLYPPRSPPSPPPPSIIPLSFFFIIIIVACCSIIAIPLHLPTASAYQFRHYHHPNDRHHHHPHRSHNSHHHYQHQSPFPSSPSNNISTPTPPSPTDDNDDITNHIVMGGGDDENLGTGTGTGPAAVVDDANSRIGERFEPSNSVVNNMQVVAGGGGEGGRGKIQLKVVTLNTWLGGGSVENGFQKLAHHIKLLDADIVGLQEIRDAQWMADMVKTLGPPWSGIAHKAAYSDTGILTKHKLDLSRRFEVTWGTGVGIESKDGAWRVNFVSMHLNYHSYGPYAANNKLVTTMEQILRGEQSTDGTSRQQNIEELLRSGGFQRMLSDAEQGSVPLFVVGDFNCPSHEDWVEETKSDHGGWAFEWPATKLVVEQAGLIDAFRQLHPNVAEMPGHTWSTVQKWSGSEWDYSIPEPQDRIDFIYYKAAAGSEGAGATASGGGGKVSAKPVDVNVYAGDESALQPIPNHRHNDYPSDHYAVYGVFELSRE